MCLRDRHVRCLVVGHVDAEAGVHEQDVYKRQTLSAPESVEDSSVTLAVRQISYFNYKVGDIDKRQAVGGVMEALNKEATYGLSLIHI